MELLLFKTFYIHNHKHGGKKQESHLKRGFTVIVSHVEDDYTRAKVQVAFCSQMDNFSRKEGRSQAAAHDEQLVLKRDLRHVLAEFSRKVYGRKAARKPADFDYVMKYVV